VSPTLGRDSLIAGLQAGFVGLLLVAVYLIALYRGLGVLAVLELVMFGVITYGLVVVMGNTMGFTLSLAGIAGIIVSIGTAADSSIIYRERYRDERRAGRTVRSAAEHAFRNAWRTNLTGNTVGLLAAVVLWLLAVGPVRGFAFTLGLSTVIDTLLFATLTRSTFSLAARNPRLANAPWMGLRTKSDEPERAQARPRQKVKSR
jgi:preprotein translocase subunit SecD